VTGDADFGPELIALDVALARRIGDIELIADRFIGLAADPVARGAVLHFYLWTIDFDLLDGRRARGRLSRGPRRNQNRRI
jgi:hypothetical protein